MAGASGTGAWDYHSILEQAALADPGNYTRTLSDPSILEDVFGRSQALDLLRQYLPENLGSTKVGQQLAAYIPAGPGSESFREKARRALNATPLGGYSAKRMEEYDFARAQDDKLRRETVRAGKVPTTGLTGEIDTPTLRAGATQAAGATLADATTDGARNIWWFLNAPQALATLAVLHAVQSAGNDFEMERPDGAKGPLLSKRGLRLAAAVPAVIGMSLAVGNAARQPGYKAVVPSEADPTESADPLGETISRYFLGRTGALLPYDEFVKERPDVSRSEYEEYKAYLFGNALPVKATLEGIHGPEVTFIGKSIPVATGILPAVAAAIGAGMGVRKAGMRLKEGGQFKLLQQKQENLSEAKSTLYRTENDPSSSPAAMAEAKAAAVGAQRDFDQQQKDNDLELFKHAAGQSALWMAGAGVAGQTLESIRRALKGRAEIEEIDPEEQQVPLTGKPEVMR